jgi:hypothetical protein
MRKNISEDGGLATEFNQRIGVGFIPKLKKLLCTVNFCEFMLFINSLSSKI